MAIGHADMYISDYVTIGEYVMLISRDGAVDEIITDVGMADSIRDLYLGSVIGERVRLYRADRDTLTAILLEMSAIICFSLDGVCYARSPSLGGRVSVDGVDINLLITRSTDGYTITNITAPIPHYDSQYLKEIYL